MTDSLPTNIRDFDGLTQRLLAATFAAKDSVGSADAGHVSRNTRLSEAVLEMARKNANPYQSKVRRHG